MSKENVSEETKLRVSFWMKVLSGVLGLFITVGSIIFAMETRYAKEQAVKNQKTEITERIELVAGDILQTIKQDRKNSSILFYNQLLDQSRDRETEILQDLQRRPNDSILEQRLKHEKVKQQKIKDKLDNLLNN